MRITTLVATFLITLTSIPVPALAGAGPRQFDRILLLPDVSGSLDRAEFARALVLIEEDLPWIAHTVGATAIDVVPWAGSASCWRSPALTIDLPSPQPVDVVVPKRADADILYRSGWETKQATAAGETRRLQAAADSLYFQDCARALEPLRRLASSLPDQQDLCSAIGEVLDRCSASSKRTLAVLLTDGEAVCNEVSTSRSTHDGAWTVVVLIPTKEDQEGVGRQLDERRRGLETQAPWVQVIYAFELATGAREWLLDRLPPRAQSDSNPQGRR